VGIVTLAEALRHAEDAKLDLVQIVADAEPVVCKVIDYGKYVFEAKKAESSCQKEAKTDSGKRNQVPPRN
jgi:translation initiation factor IF-3